MVVFKDISFSSGVDSLVMLDDANQSVDEGVILQVHTPIVGRKAKSWPPLVDIPSMKNWCQEVSFTKSIKAWSLLSTHHQPSKERIFLPTLGRNIIDGKAKWTGDDLKFPGEFHYTKGYWEWTEDILSRCKSKLYSAKIYNAVHASMYTYDRNTNIMKAFLEAWCPLTNTLLTSAGELSMSLWDLHSLSDLPMNGFFYDEVIPSAIELTGVDKDGVTFIHRSCEYLFRAYYLLRGSSKTKPYSQVTVDQWVGFWSKKKSKYSQPPMRKEKKSARLASTYNPVGDFDVHGRWSNVEEAIFSKLGIRESYKEETYLAAYLACWLCTFVLPGKDGDVIRASTFKMAAIMASGRSVGLTVPVLASIYKGLNDVSNSLKPSHARSSFPSHFLYAWLAYYFKTHYPVGRELQGPKMVKFSGEGGAKYFDPREARRRIHKAESVCWTCMMTIEREDLRFVDDGRAEESSRNLFFAIRSNYLPLRHGKDFMVEPYSPHRFARQFGYHQEVPGVIKLDVRTVSLSEALTYWRLCILSRSNSRAVLVSIPSNAKKLFSKDYKEWWTMTHGTYLEDNVSFLSDPKCAPTKSKKRIEESRHLDKDIDDIPQARIASVVVKNDVPNVKVLEESKKRSSTCHLEESDSSTADCHWKRQKTQPDPPRPVDDDIPTDPSLFDHGKELEETLGLEGDSDESQDESNSPDVIPLASKVQKKKEEPVGVHKSSTSEASVFVGKKYILEFEQFHVQRIWHFIRDKITHARVDDISSLKDELLVMYESIKGYKDIDVSCVDGPLQSLFHKAAAYDDARSSSFERMPKELIEQQLSEAKHCLVEAQTRESKEFDYIKSAREEFEVLKKRMEKMSSIIKSHEELVESAKMDINKIEEKINLLEKTAPLTDEAMEILNTSKKNLVSEQEEFKNINIFP